MLSLRVKSKMRYLIAFLALAGVVVSTMALRIHYTNDVEPCSINEKWDCGVVNRSPFAEIFHVPVAAIGIAGYLALAGLALVRRRAITLSAAVLGLAFALYLAHIERDVLMVWCLYCVISLGIITLIALLSLGWVVAEQLAKRRAQASA
jgi:vitamin-K-epoxide reductase (warfarin-sensitive)